MRPLDKDKINRVLSSLKNHPEGSYVSEISRETKLPKTTVSFLLSKHLKDKIEEVKVGKGGLFKIIKLKNY